MGAQVVVHAGGRAQIREVHAGAGFLSQPSLRPYFGLGDATRIDRIEVRWPFRRGTPPRVEVLEDLEVDRVIRIGYPGQGS